MCGRGVCVWGSFFALCGGFFVCAGNVWQKSVKNAGGKKKARMWCVSGFIKKIVCAVLRVGVFVLIYVFVGFVCS